ncbi:zn-dependent exopeptidase [Neofusicoccum parvum]|nr:zn-dependent exopeptidase [Neofusicoccum parvum]
MTTTALMYDLLENPEYIDKLRDEMIHAIREDGGLTKMTLNKLKLLDSCMKESQRVSMIAAVLINRRVQKTTTLSDDADRFVGDRFLQLRQQPGHENRWQYVTVSAEHFGFGIGKQACPGRFMASNLIKIMMVHLLLNRETDSSDPLPALYSKYMGIMKSTFFPLLLATIASALPNPLDHKALLQQTSLDLPKEFLIDLGSGDTRWVTEDEKWEFRRKGLKFFDITGTPDLDSMLKAPSVKFPPTTKYNQTVKPMLEKLRVDDMRQNLEIFTSFYTRYYRSHYGAESSAWLLSQIEQILADAGAFESGAAVKPFKHPWRQSSIIASIPGKSNKTIIVGAHQDSANRFSPCLFAAPGADDDGSGTVTILEALRVFLTSSDVVSGRAENTVEFHWYSAEEGGLLGSQAIFQLYRQQRRDVKAMFQQDMTGFIQKTIEAGEPESFGVITDNVDPGLTEFVEKVITTYCGIPYVRTQCGHACSDHASATKAGYPSAFIFESEFKYLNTRIHTEEDKIEYLSFDHMLQHAKLTLALVYELAFTKFE